MGLRQLAEGVWLDTAPVRILGMHLTANMTVLRLGDRSLLLHSPIPLTPERRAEVAALGSVTHLYSPNTFHHLRIGDWAAAYPGARVHAPAGLVKKRKDLRIDRIIGSAPEPAFAGVIDELPIAGFYLEESVLFYRPARTLIVADLVHNVGKPEHAWTKFYTQMMGFYDRVALSRVIRRTAFTRLATTRRSLDAVLACPFERVVVGHGEPLLEEGRAGIIKAYEWLPRSERPVK